MPKHDGPDKSGPGGVVRSDLVSGGFFFATGAVLWILSRGLDMGTSHRPGAGYLPTILGVLLMIIGAWVGGRDLIVATKSETVPRPAFRPFLAVFGIFAFALLIEPAGFIISASTLVALGFAACGRFRILELLVLAAALVGVSILIFVVGLGQRIPLVP